MRIAVTGHLGTLGQPLVRELRARGHEVVGIDVRHSHDGVRADVGDWHQLSGALGEIRPEMVYHLAAEFGRHNGEDYTEQLWRANAVGTKNIVKIQGNMGFKLVFASSSEVYGDRDGEWMSDSEPPASPTQLTNDYAISKAVNEAQVWNGAKRHGGESMVLRFFNAYGPGEFYSSYRSVVCLFTYRALHDMPYTVYKGYHRVFQYVDDMVRTLANVPPAWRPGETINVGGREYRSVEDLHSLISLAAGVSPTRNLVTVLPLEQHNVRNKRPVIEKAEQLLGHNPTVELEEGIARTVEWMRDVYGVAA